MNLTCSHCGNAYEAHRRDSRYCSPRCRSAAHARREQGLPPLAALPEVAVDPGNVEVAMQNYLEANDVMDDPLAPAALALARRLDNDKDAVSGMAAATRSLEMIVSKLRPPADVAGVDLVDSLRFLRAVREVDPAAAAAIGEILTPDIRAAMSANSQRRLGVRLRVGGAR